MCLFTSGLFMFFNRRLPKEDNTFPLIPSKGRLPAYDCLSNGCAIINGEKKVFQWVQSGGMSIFMIFYLLCTKRVFVTQVTSADSGEPA